MSKKAHKTNMPIGLAMAMAMDADAMKNFGVMSKEEQEKVLANARNAHSREQMQSIVADIANSSAR